ncbi:MAG: hypothetical protein I3274_07200 [Candidatus Moeniiplasma glomeromycotorum]|nr:hypothetical protein [Candidatus Moeniiplasma glomeromycotorum]
MNHKQIECSGCGEIYEESELENCVECGEYFCDDCLNDDDYCSDCE